MKKIIIVLVLSAAFFLMSTAKAESIFIEKKFSSYQHGFPVGDAKNISYVKKAIDYMYQRDQKLRFKVLSDFKNKELITMIRKVDALNTTKMKEILEEYGWITISKFGANYDKKAWLLVQHADHDPFFQAGVLLVLSKLVDVSETDKKNYAYLYDRVASHFHQIGLLQKYGTQVDVENNKIKLQPYQGSLHDIDQRRSRLGLEPLNVYLKKIKQLYKL